LVKNGVAIRATISSLKLVLFISELKIWGKVLIVLRGRRVRKLVKSVKSEEASGDVSGK
jgi:hypothetical protein